MGVSASGADLAVLHAACRHLQSGVYVHRNGACVLALQGTPKGGVGPRPQGRVVYRHVCKEADMVGELQASPGKYGDPKRNATSLKGLAQNPLFDHASCINIE